MKTFIIAGSLIAATAIAGTASAQDTGSLYGSVGVQSSSTDATDANLGSLNARLGTKITPHFGVEGELAFGTSDDGPYKLTSKAAAYAVGYLPVSPRFDLIGRVGLSDSELKGSSKFENGTALDYGIGAQYHISPDYSVRADFTRSDFLNDKGTSDTATISIVKAF